MARPPQYKLADGTRVPGVTTVIKNLHSGDGLIQWAYDRGRNGLDLYDENEAAKNIGKVAHALIEVDVKGAPQPDVSKLDDGVIAKATTAYQNFKRWSAPMKFELVASEDALVSEKWRVGGTFDCAAILGRRTLIDWKTGKSIYLEAWIQVAAYGALWNEAHPDEPIEAFAVLRLGKDDDAFDYHERGADSDVMRDAWRAFTRLRELHDIAARLKKVA